MEWIIGLGGGLAATLAIAILALLSNKWSGARLDRVMATAVTDKKELADKNDELTADRDAAREAERILNDNQRELLMEIADLKTSNQTLAARVAAAEKAHHDLERVLQDHPGALPAALRDAVERLRAQIEAGKAVPAAPAGGNPSG